MDEKAELLRLKYKYRSLIVRGQLRLPLDAAARLVGPDCAYHLYGSFGEVDAACGKEDDRDSECGVA